MKTALTIAGSDSGGGAGIQADLKTFAAFQVFGLSAITAITAQNTMGVFAVQEVKPEIIAAQIDCLFEDMDIDAVKIGMVSDTEIIKTISAALKRNNAGNVVLDPVMISKSGYKLLKPEAIEELIRSLFPLAGVLTPNLVEAEEITGQKIKNPDDMQTAAEKIHAMGVKAVVIKGGHLKSSPVDVFYDGSSFLSLRGEFINSKNTHGTGCTFSSAIAACLAQGKSLPEAVTEAKEYITGAIQNSLDIGKGVGPTHHFYKFY
ncbi:phosphomethylpyrimidine kinase [Desulfofarcimen acetoxidans DSM 771]|uniref:Hydroxymethylpyrimidine/phosphomethylpyrimidine kinase n=1 Tax=Desulfofarcimen acetoxidans (strain ATCC 49208 / DSM 771 / KCTC 5769 / VKM B-1644 / 5575) TaxID=485916 RepID=C8VWV1_DESAS|nr:bifunctional hydroxymethylpyrimidine kinase/phosphomethylpyrimidine kinase [Desulfofarcimen acetoxidans]ACV62527.1 phosphomethylpyrimidine kinase [Desulfofarcimen acetoxidans DSM 771]